MIPITGIEKFHLRSRNQNIFDLAHPKSKGEVNYLFNMILPKLRFWGHFFRLFTAAFLLTTPALSLSASSQYGIRSDGKLDQLAISKAYEESDWDQVTSALENYLRKQGDSRVSENERVFAYKYLGVIYAADSLSRTKAESYFTRLLKLSSDVEIVDLYASRRVNDLFAEVKNEHMKRQAYEQRLANRGDAQVQPSPTQERPAQKIPVKRQARIEDKSGKWVWWTVGIAAAAGVGAGAYYLTQSDGGKKIETQEIDPPAQ